MHYDEFGKVIKHHEDYDDTSEKHNHGLKGLKHFHLAEDFYAMAYLGYKKDVEKKFHLTSESQGRNFYGCCWIFLIEIILVYMILKTVVYDVTNFTISTPTVNIYLCRFICSLLLHMELIEDVK